jgi:ribosomal protein L34
MNLGTDEPKRKVMPDGRGAQSRVIGCRITGFRSRARARYGTQITAFRRAAHPA